MSVGTATRLFLSHALTDSGLAGLVTERLKQAGLMVETASNAQPGDELIAHLREAISNSDAIAFLVTPRFIESQNLAFEVGAAMTFRKPIYVLFDGLSVHELPIFLRQFRAFPVTELPQMINNAMQTT